MSVRSSGVRCFAACAAMSMLAACGGGPSDHDGGRDGAAVADARPDTAFDAGGDAVVESDGGSFDASIGDTGDTDAGDTDASGTDAGGTDASGTDAGDTDAGDALAGDGSGGPSDAAQDATTDALTCAVGQQICGGTCVRTVSDPNNCGACGVVCGTGKICSAGTCKVQITLTTMPRAVTTTAMGCSTAQSFSGRKIAVDAVNDLYLAFKCGGSVYVTSSTDGGRTFSTPQFVPLTNVAEVAVQGAGPQTAYLAAIANDGTVSFAATRDAGTTWSTPTLLNGGGGPQDGVSIAVYGTNVYVGYSLAGYQGLRVLRNANGGVGPFVPTDVAMPGRSGDVLADSQGRLYATSATAPISTRPSEVGVRVSTDGGATWSPYVHNAQGAANVDWWAERGTIAAIGSMGTIEFLASNPGTATWRGVASSGGLGAAMGTGMRSYAVFAFADPRLGASAIRNTTVSGSIVPPTGFNQVSWPSSVAPDLGRPLVVFTATNTTTRATSVFLASF